MTTNPKNQHDNDYQHWIDGLLTSPAAQTQAPSTLSQRINTEIRHRRRRSLLWKTTASLTVAASITLLAFTQPQHTPVNVDRQVVSQPTPVAPANSEPTNTPPPPTATFVARSDLLAIPIKSDDPQVTIIQIYPTTHTHRRRQREATLQAINTQLQSSYQLTTNGG